jgi:hypothetical protein
MAPSQTALARPKLFIGSGTSGRAIAETLRAQLVGLANVTTWCEGESVTAVLPPIDVAAFVLDRLPERGVLVQLGVLLGALGRDRIVVLPVSGAAELPYPFQDLVVTTHPAALADRVLRVATPASPGLPVGPVARRKRRSIGTACSDRPGQTLRIADISVTGALLETFGEIPERQMLDLNLTLENGRSVGVTAKVVRIQYPQWGRVGGVGVAFTEFAGDGRQVLEKFVDDESAFALA